MKTCVIIPVYNHQEAIVHVVEALKPFGLPCYLVNDGSSAQCSAVLRRIAEQEKDWITLYERDQNGGKGAAVMDGLQLAIAGGFSHAIQIDADGQHRLADIGRFLAASEQASGQIDSGQAPLRCNGAEKKIIRSPVHQSVDLDQYPVFCYCRRHVRFSLLSAGGGR